MAADSLRLRSFTAETGHEVYEEIVSPINCWENESVKRMQREVVGIALRVTDGDLGIIAGCRKLSGLGFYVVEDWRVDPDFVVFGAVYSETDHLPLEDERSLWDPSAFEAKQAEVALFEEMFREKVCAACRSVITRFGGV
jgi:hypothetical protein